MAQSITTKHNFKSSWWRTYCFPSSCFTVRSKCVFQSRIDIMHSSHSWLNCHLCPFEILTRFISDSISLKSSSRDSHFSQLMSRSCSYVPCQLVWLGSLSAYLLRWSAQVSSRPTWEWCCLVSAFSFAVLQFHQTICWFPPLECFVGMIGTMSYNALPHHLMLTKRTNLLPDVAVQRHLLQQLAQLQTEI